ncbi:MAG TPA: hypothetical protein VLD64_07630 [Nitrosarchaeum sp.]|nr:hypothetical protein [Nitrosarchaeum sp.]
MSAKWIAIVIGSLLGAAILGISIQMIGNFSMTSSDGTITTPAAKNVTGESIVNSSIQQNPKEPVAQEAVPILSSKTTP